MTELNLIDSLIYLDKEYISGKFENETGESPETKITRTECLNAGMRIPLLSAGASSTESRVYHISTLKMLSDLHDKLRNIPYFSEVDRQFGKRSIIRWVEGSLAIHEVTITRKKWTITLMGKPGKDDSGHEEKVMAEENYFNLLSKNDDDKFALVTSREYFSSGFDSFIDLKDTVVANLSMPVHALMRIYSAQSSFKEWISVPLVILESDC